MRRKNIFNRLVLMIMVPLFMALAGCASPGQTSIAEFEAEVRRAAQSEIPRDGQAVLLFVHESCPACSRMVKAIAQQQETDWYVVVRSLDRSFLRQLKDHVPPDRIVHDVNGDVGRVLRVGRVPSTAFLTDGLRVLIEEWPQNRDLAEFTTLVEEFKAGRYRPAPALGILPGETLQGWTVADTEGVSLDMAEIQGPALITFFSRNCEACRQQLPVMERLASAHGLKVILIEPDDLEGPSAVASTSPVQLLVDRNRQVFDGLGVSATPTNLVIDRRGVVVWTDVGFREDLEQVMLLLREDLNGPI